MIDDRLTEFEAFLKVEPQDGWMVKLRTMALMIEKKRAAMLKFLLDDYDYWPQFKQVMMSRKYHHRWVLELLLECDSFQEDDYEELVDTLMSNCDGKWYKWWTRRVKPMVLMLFYAGKISSDKALEVGCGIFEVFYSEMVPTG